MYLIFESCEAKTMLQCKSFRGFGSIQRTSSNPAVPLSPSLCHDVGAGHATSTKAVYQKNICFGLEELLFHKAVCMQLCREPRYSARICKIIKLQYYTTCFHHFKFDNLALTPHAASAKLLSYKGHKQVGHWSYYWQ